MVQFDTEVRSRAKTPEHSVSLFFRPNTTGWKSIPVLVWDRTLLFMLLASKIFNRPIRNLPWRGGHASVINSLMFGLDLLGTQFNVNPRSKRIRPYVGVLSGTSLLMDLLNAKRNGQISTLVAGPNIWGTEDVLTDCELDYFISPSSWTQQYHQSLLPLADGVRVIWAAGVDTNYWTRLQPKDDKRQVLIYLKRPDHLLPSWILQAIESVGLSSKIIKYGSYKRNIYRRQLNRSLAMIYIGGTESQGIALLEAWSTDTPTFVYKNNEPIQMKSRSGHIALDPEYSSPAPYLTSDTGQFFHNFEDLRQLLLAKTTWTFSPRKWVLSNMSLEITAKRFTDILFGK